MSCDPLPASPATQAEDHHERFPVPPAPDPPHRRRQPRRLAVPLSLAHERASSVMDLPARHRGRRADRSEEHTSELQSLMRTSYAVFCLKKKTNPQTTYYK